MANVHRRFRHAAADADRHQHRLDPVVAKAVRPAELVQHHVLGAELRLDDLVAPGPADGQHPLQHQEVLDHLVGMAGGVFADRLVHQAQRELPRPEGTRVVRFGRAAGADVAHLGARQIGKTAAPGKGVPIEAFVGMTSDKGPHLVLQIERLGLR